MIEPRVSDNESQRLEILHGLKLLDTDPEERFDRVTRLAKRLFNVPIALVSLVDADRQWFKSRQGLDATETSRDISFCGHTILGDDTMIVSDASADERFADNPLVTGEPNIRFYAGQPLSAGNGCKVGTLCLIDTVQREMSEEDKAVLKDLAELVEQQFAAMEMATIDELTGISNRRGFNMLAEKALQTRKRLHHKVTLLNFDLNLFKEINDSLGHAVGDQALQDFTACLTTTFRDSDVIARLGGDEFCVLLCNAEVADIPALLQRFQKNVSDYNREKQRPYQLSYSAGTATCSQQNDMSIQHLSSQADLAMYDEKRRNRDRVVAA